MLPLCQTLDHYYRKELRRLHVERERHLGEPRREIISMLPPYFFPEWNFHEGAALSSARSVVKLHRITNCLFANCGQGLELGYSSPNHQVEVESCRFVGNGIGIRYGDCYEMSHQGYIHVRNSESLENTVYDVWNMNREHWAADTSHMSFENVVVSTPNPMYPELITYE